MKNSYLSIKKDATCEIIIEKSRFICTAKRVCGEEDAKNFVQEIKKRYPDATHNCYAYVADPDGFYARFSDDGEPSGTAGLPMLDALKNNGIFCTAVVVTRYFGGVKLGTGGLVRAYQGAVVKILNDTGVAENLLSNLVSVEISYNLYPVLLKFLDGIKHKNSNTEYLNEGVKVEFYIPTENLNSLQIKVNDITSGKGKMQVLQTEFAEY